MDVRASDDLPAGVYSDATELRLAIASGNTNAREALEACLAAIEARNDEINAIIRLDAERARQTADECDRAGQPLGPLHGIPVTVKECFDWEGHPTTWGDPDRANDIAAVDSDVVAHLKKAGAVIIGKTNIPPYLADWETANPLFGATRNPHDIGLSAGSSSGGSAAAVAAGFSYLEVGSDLGGSIRLPSHYCGVYGLKPSWRSISLRGHNPLGELRQPDIGVAGPLARSARDVALAMSVLAGKTETPVCKPVTDWRIAVLPPQEGCPIDDAYALEIDRLCKTLRDAGAEISVIDPPFDIGRATELMNLLVRAETSRQAGLIADFRARQGDLGVPQNAFAKLNERGNSLAHNEWLELHEERLRYCESFAGFLAEYDFFLCPAGASAAAPLRPDRHVAERTIPVNGKEEPALRQHLLYMFGSLFYLPALVTPIGHLEDGRPVGVQLITTYGSDMRLIACAEAMQKIIKV